MEILSPKAIDILGKRCRDKKGIKTRRVVARPIFSFYFPSSLYLSLSCPLLILPCNCKLTLAHTINFSRLGLLLKFSIHANRLFPELLPSAHCVHRKKSLKKFEQFCATVAAAASRVPDALIRKKHAPHPVYCLAHPFIASYHF